MLLDSPGWRLETILRNIEFVGRTCYKSEDKITDDSYKKFVTMLKTNRHTAMLEHGTVYLYLESTPDNAFNSSPLYAFKYWKDFVEYIINKYKSNKYSVVNVEKEHYLTQVYITTNYRVLFEHNWSNDLKYLSPFIENKHERRVTVKFICNRQVSHEFVRHRVFSFAQESTRYCNYTKGKFGNQLTFIQPCWVEEEYVPEDYNRSDEFVMLTEMLENIETTYNFLINSGWKPQQAATVLPNALKTELVMTGTITDWLGFFKLRADKHAHPQAQELAYMLKDKFIKKGFIKDDEHN